MTTQETAVSPKRLIEAGDPLLIWFDDDKTYYVTVDPEKTHSIHCGRPIKLKDLIGKSYGSWIEFEPSNVKALLLDPTIEDFIMKARRESGIIYPKDAAVLMMHCGIRTGSRVIEVGVGSGALTLALTSQVAPNGHVYSYDIREDFMKLAGANLKKAKLADYVTFKTRAGHEPFEDEGVDAVVLDVPEPWHEAENAKKALRAGGRLASLNPTYNQIETMAGALERAGFVMIEAQEVLVRGILARPGKTRPEQRMVSHTEFMLFAVRPE